MAALADYGDQKPNIISTDDEGNLVLDLNLTNFSALMDNLTSSLSVALLTKPNTEEVTGTAWRHKTHIQVHWRWLIFPFSLVILSFIFFSVVLCQNRRLRVWKSSTSPLLFHGLAERHKGGWVDNMEVVSGMDRAAGELEVKLVNTEGRRKLM